MNCNTCINKRDNGKCMTMLKPFNDFSCWMDYKKAIKIENEISEYLKRHPGDTSAKAINKNRIKTLKTKEAIHEQHN